jgi:hypothetical protein
MASRIARNVSWKRRKHFRWRQIHHGRIASLPQQNVQRTVSRHYRDHPYLQSKKTILGFSKKNRQKSHPTCFRDNEGQIRLRKHI